MSLYLTVFSEGREVDGWVFGHYSDFGYFRDLVESVADPNAAPVFMTQSDCDGQWNVEDLPCLAIELMELSLLFKTLPPHEPEGAFEHTAEFRADAQNLFECFHNADGTNIFEALVGLCDLGNSRNEPILFQ